MTNSRNIVITGVTKGIGRALAESMMRRGHAVAGCGRSKEIIKELRAEFGATHRFDTVDVSSWEQVKSWSIALLHDREPPDLLINNAGVINRNAPLWQISDEEFSRIMQVNVIGTANVIRAILPAMIQEGRGVVVNISSGWGRCTAPEVAPYCASKYAVEGLTEALSQELPAGLAAVAVNPGIIDTDMLRTCWGDGAAGYPSPEDWSERAANFMLSLSVSDNGKSLSVG